MWVSVDSQRPAHLGAPRPHADPPASLLPRQSLGDLGGDGERPAAALRALPPFLSPEQPHPCGGRGVPARPAPPPPPPRHRPLGPRQRSPPAGASIPQRPAVRTLLTRCPRLHTERFPGYAPDLNPDEFVWTHFKATLANGRPDNLAELMAALCRIAKKARKRPALLRSFITASELPAFL